MQSRLFIVGTILLACGPGPGSDDGTTTDAPATDTADATGQPTGSSDTTPDPTGNDTGQTTPGGPGPQATPWQIVVEDLPFPLADIHTVTFGRKEYNENFANRGDIEVLFDKTDERITIEMRKYDFSDTIDFLGDELEGFPGHAELISAWAFNENTANPQKPTDADLADPTKNCLLESWKDNCALYLYYDGKSQPVRSGADFRVHLPKAYRGELNLQTEDNDSEVTYPRRGDITVTGVDEAGWCGSGTIKMSAGVARVRMCRDLTPAPLCTADQIQQCDTWQDDGEPAAWSPNCPCKPDFFGQTRIESLKPWAADITVDIPDTTWLNATVANHSENKPHDCKPVLACSGACEMKDDSDYSKAAEFNYPGPAAPAGAGYNLTVLSAGCYEVDFFADEYAPYDPDALPLSAERGHVEVCSGCL